MDYATISKKAAELNCRLFAMRQFLGDYEQENKVLVKMAADVLKDRYNFGDFVDRAF